MKTTNLVNNNKMKLKNNGIDWELVNKFKNIKNQLKGKKFRRIL